MSRTVILNIPDSDYVQAQQIAAQFDCGEEKLYLELIHEGLKAREQWLYWQKLKISPAAANPNEVLALLDKAPNIPPSAEDVMP